MENQIYSIDRSAQIPAFEYLNELGPLLAKGAECTSNF
jgi:hypothetical protein